MGGEKSQPQTFWISRAVGTCTILGKENNRVALCQKDRKEQVKSEGRSGNGHTHRHVRVCRMHNGCECWQIVLGLSNKAATSAAPEIGVPNLLISISIASFSLMGHQTTLPCSSGSTRKIKGSHIGSCDSNQGLQPHLIQYMRGCAKGI